MSKVLTIQRGTTSYKCCGIMLRSAATGLGITGKVAADLTARTERGNAASASLTLSDLSTFTSAYSSGGLKEDGSTAEYRLDLPDALLATGADSAKEAYVFISGATILDYEIQVLLTDYVPDTTDPNVTSILTLVSGSYGIKKNAAKAAFPFPMTDSTTHLPATGLTVTATRRIDSGSFAACANAVSEIGSGAYTINLAASDLNGDTIMFKFSATGADTLFITVVTSPA